MYGIFSVFFRMGESMEVCIVKVVRRDLPGIIILIATTDL
jgi:hypothetical protein